MRVLPCWSDYLALWSVVSLALRPWTLVSCVYLYDLGVFSGVISGVISGSAAVELKLEPPVGRGRRGELNLNKKCAERVLFVSSARASSPRPNLVPQRDRRQVGATWGGMGRHGEAWGEMGRDGEI